MSDEDKTLTITTTEPGTLDRSSFNSTEKAVTKIVLIGSFNSNDLNAIRAIESGDDAGFNSVITVDMSLATFPKQTTNYWGKTENDKPANPNVGDKFYFGGTLYQLSITTTKSWTPVGELGSPCYEYTSVANRNNDKDNRQSGDYAKTFIYVYYKYVKGKKWSGELTDRPSSGSDRTDNTYTPSSLPPASNYNKDDYMKFMTTCLYYQLQGVWVSTDETNKNEDVDWSTNNISEWTKDKSNGYIVYLTNEGTYYKFVKSWIVNSNGDNYVTDNNITDNNKDNYLDNYAVGTYLSIPTYVYYQVIEELQWVGPQDTTDGIYNLNENADNSITVQSLENRSGSEGDGIKFLDRTEYHILNETQDRNWNERNETTTATVYYFYANTDQRDADVSVTNDSYVVVGVNGNKSIYNGTGWDTWDGLTVTNDWTQVNFSGWQGLETIILPDDFNVEEGKTYNNFYGDNNLSTIQSIVRGESSAAIGRDSGNNRTAEITCDNNDFDNMKAIVKLNSLVSQDDRITQVTNDGDYIQLKEGTTNVYEVHVTHAGSLKSKYTHMLSSMSDAEKTALTGAVFRFDNQCTGFTAEDLQALANPNGPYLYVDLYDVTTTSEIETAIEDAIKGNNSGINKLANNQHYKGLLLPENPTRIGTALIENSGTPSPISDFIAYHNGSTTTAHIYDTDPSTESNYSTKLTTLKGLMDTHLDNNNNKVIETETTVYLVSTNCKTSISNVMSIKGNATASIVHTYNNEMVNPDSQNPQKPSIKVMPTAAGGYATLNSKTNMRNTANTEVLKFTGAINAADIQAVNSFTQAQWSSTDNAYVEVSPKSYNGPRVLDLSEVTSTITKELLNNLNNTKIEYIILPAPARITEDVVGDYTNLTNLKCVISSDKSSTTGDKVLTAYVKVAGSLAEARCLATENDDNTIFKPKPQGLTKVKLSGNLNSSDIATSDGSYGLRNEFTTITSIDLTDAYFATLSDMRLGGNGAGFNQQGAVLTEVKLPTSHNTIPNKCLYGIKSLTNLHIPYNYTTIEGEAFWETKIDHITAEDANHTLIDNGPKTWTLSANIATLGELDHAEGTAVFPEKVAVTDVYCLATKVPTCYAHTFHADIVYGHGGENGAMPYCRERYIKNIDNNEVIAVLHYPSVESYNNVKKAEDKEGTYSEMEEKYTDTTRAYTKFDQTGAVDANGNPLKWPDQSELEGTRKMAEAGHIWTDYGNISYAADGHLQGFNAPTVEATKPFYPDYVGWHEFTLTHATYMDSPEEVVNNTIERVYTQPGWYTFCIPYNLTYSQVVKMMGVPASDTDFDPITGLKVINKVGNTIQTADLMPDIRQLKDVVRKKGDQTTNNEVIFRLTENLYKGSKTTQYLEFTESGDNEHSKADLTDAGSGDDPICLVGGRPYYIKPYLPEGVTPSKSNLGKYIMTRYADELGLDQSCLKNGEEFYEQLEIFTYNNGEVSGISNSEDNTMRFAKPYEKHKVQAVADGEDAGQVVYDVTEDGVTKRYKYYYTMIGQFWEQDLPQFCFYMSGQTWYRYPVSKGYKWAPYKCIIMATPEVVNISEEVTSKVTIAYKNASITPAATSAISDDRKPHNTPTAWSGWNSNSYSWNHFGGGYRDFQNCYFPMNMPGTNNLLLRSFSLCFFGRNDYSFDNDTSVGAYQNNTRYIFSFGNDDNIVDIDGQENNATYIETLDGVPQFTTDDLKVYSLSGQYMGKSTEGLPRGIYIVGGRKVVVD